MKNLKLQNNVVGRLNISFSHKRWQFSIVQGGIESNFIWDGQWNLSIENTSKKDACKHFVDIPDSSAFLLVNNPDNWLEFEWPKVLEGIEQTEQWLREEMEG